MATTQCPACGLTVPYFCCEGLVCPACGYDEEQTILPERGAVERNTSEVFSREPLTIDSRVAQPPAE